MGRVSAALPSTRRWTALCAVVIGLVSPGTAPAASAPQTPQSRLLDVWLDLRLVSVFYPDTTAETLLPNLAQVADQLGQPLPPLRFGEAARDTLRFRSGAVMIKQHPPADTWILFSRWRAQVWRLIDDAQGRLRLTRVA